MTTISLRISDRDLFVVNVDLERAKIFEKAGLPLPPMPWLICAGSYTRDERDDFWRRAFELAGVVEWSHYRCPRSMDDVYKFLLQ